MKQERVYARLPVATKRKGIALMVVVSLSREDRRLGSKLANIELPAVNRINELQRLGTRTTD